MEKLQFEYLAKQIWEASLEVHKEFGPGLLESAYSFGLIRELQLRNIKFLLQVKVPLFYKGFDTGKEYYMDLLVENEIVIEVKSCEIGLNEIHKAQLISYLRLSNKRMGFLINFNVPLLKSGLKRIVNNY